MPDNQNGFEALLKALDSTTLTTVIEKASLPPTEDTSGLKFNPLPTISDTVAACSVIYVSEEEEEFDKSRLGQGYFDQDSNIVTFYLPAGLTVTKLKVDQLQKYIEKNITVIPMVRVLEYSLNPEELRTCVYFTAPRANIDNVPGIALSRDYEFDRPFQYASCSHPDTAANAACGSEQCQFACRIYKGEDWTDIVVYKEVDDSNSAEKTVYKLQSIRRSTGLVHYRILQGVEGASTVVSEFFNDGITLSESKASATLALESLVNSAPEDFIEINVVDIDTTIETYYNYALSS